MEPRTTGSPGPLAVILFAKTQMTEEQIIKAAERVEGIGGMTVNERLFVSGLMPEFEDALQTDKTKAKQILRLLKVDETSIQTIVV